MLVKKDKLKMIVNKEAKTRQDNFEKVRVDKLTLK